MSQAIQHAVRQALSERPKPMNKIGAAGKARGYYVRAGHKMNKSVFRQIWDEIGRQDPSLRTNNAGMKKRRANEEKEEARTDNGLEKGKKRYKKAKKARKAVKRAKAATFKKMKKRDDNPVQMVKRDDNPKLFDNEKKVVRRDNLKAMIAKQKAVAAGKRKNNPVKMAKSGDAMVIVGNGLIGGALVFGLPYVQTPLVTSVLSKMTMFQGTGAKYAKPAISGTMLAASAGIMYLTSLKTSEFVKDYGLGVVLGLGVRFLWDVLDATNAPAAPVEGQTPGAAATTTVGVTPGGVVAPGLVTTPYGAGVGTTAGAQAITQMQYEQMAEQALQSARQESAAFQQTGAPSAGAGGISVGVNPLGAYNVGYQQMAGPRVGYTLGRGKNPFARSWNKGW